MTDTASTTPASPSFEKLKVKLRELFELDKADLDFGIYRIMNQKRDEVVRFLEKGGIIGVSSFFNEKRTDTNNHDPRILRRIRSEPVD